MLYSTHIFKQQHLTSFLFSLKLNQAATGVPTLMIPSAFISRHTTLQMLVRILLLSVCVFFFLSSSFCPAAPIPSLISGPSDTEKTHNPEDRNLSDLIPKGATLQKKQIEMQAELSAMHNTITIKKQLRELSAKRDHLQEQLNEIFTQTKIDFQHLTSLQEILQETRNKNSAASKKVRTSIAVIDKWVDYWSREEQDLSNWHTGLGPISSLAPVQDELTNLQTTINESKKILEIELLPLLETQKKAGALQVTTYELYLQMEQVFKSKFQHGISQQAASLFSSDFINQFNRDLWQKTVFSMKSLLNLDDRYLVQEQGILFISFLLYIILTSILFSTRSYLTSSAHWQFITKCPFTISFFITLVFFYTFSSRMPVFWVSVYRLAVLISVIRISSVLIQDRLQRNFITRLSLLLLLTNFLVMFKLPMPLMRLYLVCVCLSLLTLYFVQSTRYKNEKRPSWLLWTRRIGALTLVGFILGEINGQADMVFFSFSGILQTLFAALFVWILYLLLQVLLELTVSHIPFSLLKKNTNTIIGMIRPVLFVVCASTFLGSVLVDWHLFSNATDAINYIRELGFEVEGGKISVGLLVAAGLLLYAAYCISKMTQSILLQTVLPRKNVDKGVQLSITRLLHYSIMLIGFLLALQALGFSLTNLTILGGALGVGIGFGLQAIINNFASGLILLFERPIKVGDTIQVGDEMAEVKELGLRATIVQTFDNAEIVVPNSDLITSQVTNWTLKERRIRVRIPVGVAYGSDLQEVLKILLTCAEERPEVLPTPKASALFLAFGDSSLDFELRFFIPEFSDRRRIQSELNLDIYRELVDAGIEIPFPQNDLHLKTISAQAAEALDPQMTMATAGS